MSTAEDLRHDAIREQMLDSCEALHADYIDPDCPGCAERVQQRLEDERIDGSAHHDHIGTLHWANGWPIQLCSRCLQAIDHRACLECGAATTSRGRQISEAERREAWGS